MRKEVLFVGLFLFLLIGPGFVCAELSDTFEDRVKQIKDVQENISDAKEKYDGTDWSYLGKEWQSRLLSNKYVSVADSFFKKINIVFVIFFGEDYSLSLVLFLIIVLWFFFFLKFAEIFKTFLPFSKSVSYLIAGALAVILAQFKILRKLVEFFGWLTFSVEAKWIRFAIIIGLAILMFFIYRLISIIVEEIKKRKESEEMSQARFERALWHDIFKRVFSKNN